MAFKFYQPNFTLILLSNINKIRFMNLLIAAVKTNNSFSFSGVSEKSRHVIVTNG